MRRVVVVMMAALVGATVLAGCSSGSGGGTTAQGGLNGTVTVFAASSLMGTFKDIAHQFEAAHPGVKVQFSFGASDDLATQIVNGAPADVFASASTKTMGTVTKAGDASNPTDFATNTLEIATPPSNPGKITSLASLAKLGVKVALCQPAVPCGETAQKMLTKNHLHVTPATLSPDVKAVLTVVELGEVDAGVVYVTDVLAAGSKVKGVVIPPNANETTTYPIATVKSSKNSSVANAFKAYVLSSSGQKVLKQAGFAAA